MATEQFNDLGSFLKSKRDKSFLTQKEMSLKLGITEEYYNAIENNKIRCGANVIKKIIELTKVKPSFVYDLWQKTEIKKYGRS